MSLTKYSIYIYKSMYTKYIYNISLTEYNYKLLDTWKKYTQKMQPLLKGRAINKD